MHISLAGHLVGSIWMPAMECSQYISADLTREQERFTEKPTLRELLLHILMEHGGDFRSASFSRETTITLETTQPRKDGKGYRTRRRCYELTQFPTVADLVDVNAEVFE